MPNYADDVPEDMGIEEDEYETGSEEEEEESQNAQNDSFGYSSDRERRNRGNNLAIVQDLEDSQIDPDESNLAINQPPLARLNRARTIVDNPFHADNITQAVQQARQN